MRRVLPSLTALQFFESSARHLSFTRAAEELNVTQSAISRQIRALEEYLGRDLFRRIKKRLKLTAAGEAYATQVRDLLDRAEAATLQVMAYSDSTLRAKASISPFILARRICRAAFSIA